MDFKNIVKEIVINKKSYIQLTEEYGTTKDKLYKGVKALKQEYGYTKQIGLYFYLLINGLVEEFKNEYKNGISTLAIGKKYNCCDNAVAKALRECGVELRCSGKISKTDQTIFKIIDTREKAYTLGLIMADGSINSTNRNLSITLTKDDKYLLEKIDELVFGGFGHFIESHKKEKKSRWVLQVHGKEMCECLNEYNIIPNKSLKATEFSNKIPKEYYSDYIRGLFDGDGVCSKSNGKVRIGFCSGSESFLMSYRSYMIKELGLNCNKIFKTGPNCYQISWAAKKDLIAFYNYIYKDNPTIFLGRKRKKLYDFIKDEVNY